MLNVQDAPTVRTMNDGDTEALGHEGTRAESWVMGDVHAPIYGRRAARLETTNAQHFGVLCERGVRLCVLMCGRGGA